MSSPHPPSLPPWIRNGTALCLIVALGAATALRLGLSHDHLVFTDRDLLRAAQPDGLPLGAELSYASNARVPGGAYTALLRALLLVSADPAVLHRAATLGTLLAALLTGALLGRRHGIVPALLAALVALCSPALVDGTTALWNPTLLPLPVALGWVLTERAVGRARPVLALAAGALWAVALQVHLSAAWGLLPCLGVLAWKGPRHAISAALLGLLLPYLPYLAHEAGGGWGNTAPLLARAGTGASLDGWGALRALREIVPTLLGLPTTVLARPAQAVLFGLAGAGAIAASRKGAPIERALAASVGLAVLGMAIDPRIQPALPGTGRYLIVAAPGLGALVGLGAARLLVAAPRATALSVAVLAAVTWTAASLPAPPPSWTQHATRAATLAALQDATGWSLRDVAGRTVVLQVERGAWSARRLDGLGYALLQDGFEEPGSLEPPCGAILLDATTTGHGLALDPGFLGTRAGASVQVTRDMPLGERHRFVEYTLDRGRCRTSFAQPYIPTPTERLVEAKGASLRLGEVGFIDTPAGTLGVFLVDVEGGVPFPVGLLLDNDRRTLSLHARALRGPRLAGVDRTPAHLLAPTVTAAKVLIPLALGRIGDEGERTPVFTSVPMAVPEGPLTLRATVQLGERVGGRTRSLEVVLPYP